MTTVDRPQPVPVPTRVGQATVVEQSRAAAEVHAAVVVAQQCPRNIVAAVEAMRAACTRKSMAERAFYRYARGGTNVTGESIHLARELARCWGNVQYGQSEMRRDDEGGQSEMLVFAWDVQTNTRNSQTIIVPHKRDKRGGPEVLTDLRDIYENNANNAARRLRQSIFAILPAWFVEEAKDLCAATLANDGGSGRTIEQRRADAVKVFGDEFGITVDQLEQHQTRPADQWTPHDLAQLHVVLVSLRRGEITRDEEFPPVRVTAAEVVEPARRRATRVTEAPAAEPAHQPGEDAEAWPEARKPADAPDGAA